MNNPNYKPKYIEGDRVLYDLISFNDSKKKEVVELIIICIDQWLEYDKCWLYRAISTITNQIVFVKEIHLNDIKVSKNKKKGV